jgi:hypothetical protein
MVLVNGKNGGTPAKFLVCPDAVVSTTSLMTACTVVDM